MITQPVRQGAMAWSAMRARESRSLGLSGSDGLIQSVRRATPRSRLNRPTDGLPVPEHALHAAAPDVEGQRRVGAPRRPAGPCRPRPGESSRLLSAIDDLDGHPDFSRLAARIRRHWPHRATHCTRWPVRGSRRNSARSPGRRTARPARAACGSGDSRPVRKLSWPRRTNRRCRKTDFHPPASNRAMCKVKVLVPQSTTARRCRRSSSMAAHPLPDELPPGLGLPGEDAMAIRPTRDPQDPAGREEKEQRWTGPVPTTGPPPQRG